ncbi:MAG: ABC transporter ATP-binding protein [Clostridia bacterium]|nr:ABC transporter ATP-binding protein [Clostridia bacterium]
MCVGLGIKSIGTIVELIIPWILSYIIDELIPIGEIRPVVIWGMLMILCSMIGWAGNITANRMASSVARDFTREIRHDLFAKISYLSERQVDNLSIPSLISRMTSDTYVLHQTVGMIQRIGIRAPILLIGGIIVTLTLDPVLTLIMVATLPIVGVLTFYVSRKGVRLFKIVQRGVDELTRVVRENAVGVRVIKALSKSEYERGRFKKVNDDLTHKEQHAERTMALINPIMTLLLNAGIVAVIVAGAYRVNNGTTEIGKIIAFMNLFTIVLNALMAINRIFDRFSRAAASSARVVEVLDSPVELFEKEAHFSFLPENQPHISFENMTFKYERGTFAVRDLNFDLKRGETLGIIGATGAGKSTVIRTLMRYYDVSEGAIKIDGVNIKDYATVDLRRKFGVVFQNDTLFKDTIRENIRLGRDLSDEELLEAARRAQALEFIEEQGGLDAPVAIKGANLSGGQKQRLLIARALAGEPEILVLDDSSSALDYKTDSRLREEIRNHYANSTKIIVAQRVSSIMHAEKILVMENGNVIGMGTHDELMASCPLYREIGESQIGDRRPDSVQTEGKEAVKA